MTEPAPILVSSCPGRVPRGGWPITHGGWSSTPSPSRIPPNSVRPSAARPPAPAGATVPDRTTARSDRDRLALGVQGPLGPLQGVHHGDGRLLACVRDLP